MLSELTRAPGLRVDALRNRHAIVHAAAAALADGTGSSTALLDAVARRTGLARSTIYRRIGGRQEVLSAVMADQLDRLQRIVRDVAEQDRPVRTAFEALLSMTALFAVLDELPPVDQRRFLDRIARTMAPAFRRAQASGRVAPDADVRDVRYVLVMFRAARADEADGDPATRTARAARTARILVDGLIPPPSARGAEVNGGAAWRRPVRDRQY